MYLGRRNDTLRFAHAVGKAGAFLHCTIQVLYIARSSNALARIVHAAPRQGNVYEKGDN